MTELSDKQPIDQQSAANSEERKVASSRPQSRGQRIIDLRSDTVTLPSPQMRDAIRRADVGDDFYHEDPTVRALEARAAELLAKEAALYVPSGTMANLLAYLTHSPGGGAVVGPQAAHSFASEAGGPARVAGMTVRPFTQSAAELDLERISEMAGSGGVLVPPTTLLWLEQPTRGYVVSVDELAGLRNIADTHRVPVHYDGARIFNAAVALGIPASEIARHADSVMFCVSKGLAAPVGSLLTGTQRFIDAARRHRQMLGGGMRQAGILAAGGLYALDNNVERLAEDHANARRLADGLRRLDGLRVDREFVETNIFYVEVVGDDLTVATYATRLRNRGVLVNLPTRGRRAIRFVTHYGIEAADVDIAIGIAAEALR